MKNILVVEDSKLFGALVVREIQSQLGVKAVLATSYQDAVDKMESEREPFSIALLDLNLPDAPNGEIVNFIISRNIPAIVFTANFSDDMREDIWSRKVVDYVLKEGPHSVDYLIQLLKRLKRNRDHKVLVVDDSVFARTHFSELLKIQNYQVYTAGNGKEALKVLTRNPDIRLVITDYNMPIMNGFELIRQIRKKYHKDELAIIGVSGVGNKVLSAKFLKNGASDFIIKPFLAEEFYCRVTQNIEMIEYVELNKAASNRDYLTGLYNRRFFFESGRSMYASLQRSKSPVGIAMIDVDHFKKVNDQYGHEAGDHALRNIAGHLAHRFRKSDIVSRIGGEEFCVFCTNMKPEKVEEVFEAIRSDIENLEIIHNGTVFRVTISIGLFYGLTDTLDSMVNRADNLLYKAKKNGRNRVEIEIIE